MASVLPFNNPKSLTPQHTGASVPSYYSSTTSRSSRSQSNSTAATSYQPSLRSDSSGAYAHYKITQPDPKLTANASSKMSKSKPSPDSGAVRAARIASANHGKLHKRNTDPTTTPPVGSGGPSPQYQLHSSSTFTYGSVTSPDALHEDLFDDSPALAASKSKTKIKPFLRKLGAKESNSLDLSRPTYENEGLGIYTDYGKKNSMDGYTPTGRTSLSHHRSTSGGSQLSNGSNPQRPGAQFSHPMRQTPRPYTPTIAQSYSNSEFMHDEQDSSPEPLPAHFPRTTSDLSTSTGFIAHTAPRVSANPTSTSSLNRVTPQASRSNLSLSHVAAAHKSSNANVTSHSPPYSGRPSLDISFRIRSRDSPQDPEARAASIRAARQAFTEKEEAKARKQEKNEMQAQRKREAKEEATKKRNEARDRHLLAHKQRRRNGSTADQNEKSASVAGHAYTTMRPSQQPLPMPESESDVISPTRTGAAHKSAKHAAKSRWVRFVTWLRTRIFKMKRKVNGGGRH